MVILSPFFVEAASLSFEPQDSSAGIGEPFVVALNVTADEGVNAFEVVLDVPRALTPIDVSDGNSMGAWMRTHCGKSRPYSCALDAFGAVDQGKPTTMGAAFLIIGNHSWMGQGLDTLVSEMPRSRPSRAMAAGRA